MARRIVPLVLLLVALFGARRAGAHAAPHSVLLLDLRANDVAAELRMPTPELEAALARPFPSSASVLGEQGVLQALVIRDLHLSSPDGQAWRVAVDALAYAIDEQSPVVVMNLTFSPASGHSVRSFTIVDDVIGKQVVNHTTWIAVRSDFAQGLVSGPASVVGVTRYLHHQLRIERQEGGVWRGILAVFRLGVQHIAEGTDHLLFLLTLLLPAPLLLARENGKRPRWRAGDGVRASLLKVLRIVTAFTLGHSLTLLVGTIGWLRLPSAVVETLIGVSILLSAAHALRPLFPGREAWIAAGFGLIHGLAFARALAELQLAPAHLALALLAFNLGIEAMQLAVIACVLPWLLLLARTPGYAPVRIAGALFAASAASAWIVQRALNIPTPVDTIAGAVTARPQLLLAGLAVLSLIARVASPALLAVRRRTGTESEAAGKPASQGG